MQYEVTIKLLIKTCVDEDRLMHQIESLFGVGTVTESFSDALKLDVAPHFLNVTVLAASARATTVE
jgi:hypothetical protein